MVVIRSCRGAGFRDGHPALAANVTGQWGATGEVQANRWGPAGSWEQWHLQILDYDGNNYFHHHIVGHQNLSEALSYLAEPLRVGLHSHHGGYWLRANPDGSVWADAPELNEWETWTLEPHGYDQHHVGWRFAFRSCHGKYLCCDGGFPVEGNNVCANRDPRT